MKKNLTLSQFKDFAKLIEEYSGIRLEENRLSDLNLAVLVRTKELDLLADKYFRLLRSGLDEEELKKLVGYLTINETSFMRYQDQYVILKEVVVPQIKAIAGKKEINVWSAGCSTGEEPYSIAIILLEMMPEFKIKIIGTDIDKEALEKAKRAVYNRRSIRLLNKSQLKKYFKEISQNKFVLDDSVREIVQFSHHNLLSLTAPAAFSFFNIVFCRNVIIYFKKENVAKIVDLFYKSLVDGGYLFLGHTESLFSICDGFKSRELGKAFVYQKISKNIPEPKPKTIKPQITTPSLNNRRVKHREKKVTFSTSSVSRLKADDNFNKALKLYIGKKASRALREIKKLKTTHLMSGLLKAQVLLELDSGDEAKGLCLAILKRQPLSGYPYLILGLACLKDNNEAEAIENFKKAAYSLKEFGLPHFFIANIYRRRKDFKRAVLEYKKCSRLLSGCKENDIWKILSPQFSPYEVAKTCEKAFSKQREKRYAS